MFHLVSERLIWQTQKDTERRNHLGAPPVPSHLPGRTDLPQLHLVMVSKTNFCSWYLLVVFLALWGWAQGIWIRRVAHFVGVVVHLHRLETQRNDLHRIVSNSSHCRHWPFTSFIYTKKNVQPSFCILLLYQLSTLLLCKGSVLSESWKPHDD